MNTSSPEIDLRLRTLLASSMRTTVEMITPSTRFVADLRVDSLDVVEALMAVEDEFEIEILDEDAEGLITYHDAFSYIVRRLGEREGRAAHESPTGLLEDIPSAGMTAKQLAQALALYLGQMEAEPEDLFNWHTVGPLVGRYSIAMVPEVSGGIVKAWRCQAFEAVNEPQAPVGRGYDADQLSATVRAILDLQLALSRAAAVLL